MWSMWGDDEKGFLAFQYYDFNKEKGGQRTPSNAHNLETNISVIDDWSAHTVWPLTGQPKGMDFTFNFNGTYTTNCGLLNFSKCFSWIKN